MNIQQAQELSVILRDLTGVEWEIKEIKTLDRFKLDIKVPDPDAFIRHYFPVPTWKYIMSGKNSNQIVIRSFHIYRILAGGNFDDQMVNSDQISPYQVTRAQMYLRGTRVRLDINGIKFEINKSVLSSLPEKLLEKLHWNSETNATLPLDQAQYFYDFFEETFPLYEPTNPTRIKEKFRQYIDTVFRQNNLTYGDYSFSYGEQSSDSIYLNLKSERAQFIVDLCQEIIKFAFPGIKNLDTYIKVNVNHLFPQFVPGMFISDEQIVGLTFHNILEIYHHLWHVYIIEPLIRSHFGESIPLPSVLQNLIGEYYSSSEGPSHYYEQQLRRRQNEVHTALESGVNVQDVRNLINEYSGSLFTS